MYNPHEDMPSHSEYMDLPPSLSPTLRIDDALGYLMICDACTWSQCKIEGAECGYWDYTRTA